jgi:membrane-associated phospholipid phosphatase
VWYVLDVQPRTTLSATVALVVYVGMWAGYLQEWSWLNTVDHWLLAPFREFGLAHPAWVASWNWFCILFSPTSFRIVTVFVIAWFMRQRRFGPALFLLVSVELSGVVTGIAKVLVNRPRPSTALVYAPSTSFPSGHALGVMVCVLALLTVLLPMVAANWRAAMVLFGVIIVLAIGVGRVVLNVHHPSDVVAGWALGYLYYLLCLPLLTAKVGTPATPGTTR